MKCRIFVSYRYFVFPGKERAQFIGRWVSYNLLVDHSISYFYYSVELVKENVPCITFNPFQYFQLYCSYFWLSKVTSALQYTIQGKKKNRKWNKIPTCATCDSFYLPFRGWARNFQFGPLGRNWEFPSFGAGELGGLLKAPNGVWGKALENIGYLALISL